MRIAMVSEHASPLATLGGVDAGGQNVHVEALAATMARIGHDVTVFTRRDSEALPQRVRMASGVNVVHVDAGPPRPIAKDAIYDFVPDFADRLREAWLEDRPEIVHSHFWMSGLAALDAARDVGMPLVHTFHALGVEKRRHQGHADTSPPSRIADEARLACEADRLVPTSSAEMFEVVRMGARARTLKVVPCGVDLERFTPYGPRESRARGRMRVVALSRLVPRKGIDSIIEAISTIPRCELVIAGGGESRELADDPEARRLFEIARSSGAAERVCFRGRMDRDSIPALLRSADVVVCAPWYEPFGIVPLEAMACGVPVIVSAVGGLVDTVVDKITGFHVAPRDSADLSLALEALRRDPALRKEMGRLGTERVAARYSWSRVAADTLDVYREAIRLGPSDAFATGT